MTKGEGRDRWTLRYAEAAGPDKAASAWLLDAALQLPSDATIVDLAGGLGRHARPLARRGRHVILVDFVERALRAATVNAPGISAVVADLWNLPFADESLDAILVANFLERDLFPVFHRLLKPGGYLLYETYTRDNATLVAEGRARAPRSPQYMVATGELLALVAPLEVLSSREGLVEDDAGRRACASILARKGAGV
jgi:SAM-dependent methyltransferase